MFNLINASWSTILISSFTALIAWELGWIIYCRTVHPLAKVPGPFLASISRLWIWRAIQRGQMHTEQHALHRKHGRLVRIAPNELACSDAAAVKDLYRNQKPLEKSDFYQVWTSTAFGNHKDNFSVINEKEHSDRRRIVNHVYSMSNVLKSELYIDKCSTLFIEKLGHLADTSQAFDLGQWLQMYAFDVIGELYFGQMFGFMEKEYDHESLIHSLDVLNPLLAGMAGAASYARTPIVLSALLSGKVRTALKGIDHVTKTSKVCVKQRLDHLQNNDEESVIRQDLLQQLIGIMQDKGDKVDFGIPEIEYEAYVALFAGSDTTAIAMRSVFYHLLRSSTVLKELLIEIDTAFPPAQHPLNEPISYAEAIKLPLLCATIKEAMRLHPSVAFTMPRIAPTEGLKIDGTFIPNGYRVGINAYVLQRDEQVFAPNPNEFRPQRWLEENTSVGQLREMDRCMLQFGGGTRTCIGKNISLSEMHKLIPQILRNFDLSLVDDSRGWIHHNFWFNKQVGLNVRLTRRALR